MKNFSHKWRTCGLAIATGLVASLLASCGGGETTKEGATTEVTAPAATAYTVRQQVFSMCMLANIGAYYNGQGNIDSLAVVAVNKVLADAGVQSLIGNWQCVWGPVVYDTYKNGKYLDTAANAMFIVRQQGTPNFIVAIAGTDPASAFEWEFEDMNITPILWDLKDKSKGYVTTATKTGVAILETMSFNNVMPDSFLRGCADTIPNMNIWVTGHSLGGALAPSYALHIKDSLNAKNAPTINVLAAAGATPGDATFAAYYNSRLGQNTIRVWNTRDAVPHGFEPDMLAEVDTLYPKDSVTAFPWYMKPFVNAMKKIATACNYTQLRPDSTFAFTSAIYTKDSAIHKKANPISDTSYMGQILYQHIPAYGVYFNTFNFQQAVQRVLNMQSPYFTEGAYLVPVWPSNADH